jgi:PKD repeat protein
MLGSGHGRLAGRERLFAVTLLALALAIGPFAGSALAAAPTAGFAANPNPAVIGGTVLLDARDDGGITLWGSGRHNKLGSTDDGTITTYEWDLDDDGAYDDATGATTSVVFNTLGDHVVHLRVTDNELLTDTAAVTIKITTFPPTAALSLNPSNPSSLTSILFDASGSTDPDDAIVSYDWDFDGDGSFDATTVGPTTTHSYATPGARHAVVRVTDASGAMASKGLNFTVANLAPSAAFTAPSVTDAGDVVNLDASTSGDLDGSIAHYRWDFDGNGIFDADTPSPTLPHVFAANGTYLVRLQVADNLGATTDVVHAIVVTGAPVAVLSILTDPAVAGSPVSLDATGSFDPDGAIDHYDWDLDGNGSYETNTGADPTVTRTYPNAGTVTVRVRVTDDQGGQGTAAQVLIVKPAPSAPGPSGGSGDGAGTGTGGSGAGGSSGAGGAGGAGDDPVKDTDAVVASLSGTSIQKLRPVLRKGLAMGCQSDRAVRCEVVLQIGKRTIGRAVLTLKKAGSKNLKIKLSARARRLLKHTRSAQVIVRGSATDARGHTTTLRRAFLIRR